MKHKLHKKAIEVCQEWCSSPNDMTETIKRMKYLKTMPLPPSAKL